MMIRGVRRVAPTLALLAVVVSLGAPGSSSAAQAPKGFFGVHPRFIDGDIDYAEMRAADVGLLRTGFNIAAVKAHANDAYDWRHLDSIVTGTAENGIDLLPVLYGVPRYISTKPGVVPLGTSETEWRAFLAALVERYGPDGEFWSLHPAVPYRPIGKWQIWNEENALSNWRGKPNPREYGRLLAISGRAIHAEDPDALLVTGGVISTPQNPKAINGIIYLKRMLKSKAAKRAADIIAIHPYSGAVREVKRQYRLTRRMLDDARLRRTPIWVTEIGWGTGSGDRNPLIVSPARQRHNLRRTFRMTLQMRQRFEIGRLVWYQWRDGTDNICKWCGTSGLLREDGVAKPLLKVFSGIARL
jgi:hypothetical protein